MAMALTGDTATQEETFDVPVVARGTFLGQRHPWSGKEAGPARGAGEGPCSQTLRGPGPDRLETRSQSPQSHMDALAQVSSAPFVDWGRLSVPPDTSSEQVGVQSQNPPDEQAIARMRDTEGRQGVGRRPMPG